MIRSIYKRLEANINVVVVETDGQAARKCCFYDKVCNKNTSYIVNSTFRTFLFMSLIRNNEKVVVKLVTREDTPLVNVFFMYA